MSEAQKLMAEVMQRHARFERWEDDQGGTSRWAGYECGDDCDWHGKTVSEYFEHVAAEMDKALGGLTREYCARHHSGGGALGFTTESDASRHIADNPPVPGGVERPPDPGYSGVESRWVSSWTEAPHD